MLEVTGMLFQEDVSYIRNFQIEFPTTYSRETVYFKRAVEAIISNS